MVEFAMATDRRYIADWLMSLQDRITEGLEVADGTGRLQEIGRAHV